MKIRAIVNINGRVQGVGFRRFTFEKAVGLKVTGWVRNLADGSVGGCFEGTRENVEALVDLCRVGPERAAVSTVKVDWFPAQNAFAEFQVIPPGPLNHQP